MIPPRAKPRRLDRVWVPPSTSRQLEGVFIPLSLFDSASRFIIVSLAWPDVARKSHEKKLHYLIHQIDGVKMLHAIERQLSDNNFKGTV